MLDKDLRQKILTNELGQQMLDSVAPIYDNSRVALHLFQALGTVLGKEIDFVNDDFIKQIFPQTATWGLRYWEEHYGIVTDVSKTIEERRAYFMSMIFNKPPMTPKRIASIVTDITGLQCKVTENTAPNTFQVTMRGGYPKDLNGLYEVLDAKTPAHLIYTIKGIETIETTSDTYPIVVGDFSESFGETMVAAYTDEVEYMTETTAYFFQAMATGNMAEKLGEIEVIN